jgi:hypothetical protein
MCCASLLETVTEQPGDLWNAARFSIAEDARILTHKITHRLRSYGPFQRLGSPRRERKSLTIRICRDSHGRGRGSESRRPRHYSSHSPGGPYIDTVVSLKGIDRHTRISEDLCRFRRHNQHPLNEVTVRKQALPTRFTGHDYEFNSLSFLPTAPGPKLI